MSTLLHQERYLVDPSTLNEWVQKQELKTQTGDGITSRQFLKEDGKCFERRAVSWRLMAKMRVPLS